MSTSAITCHTQKGRAKMMGLSFPQFQKSMESAARTHKSIHHSHRFFMIRMTFLLKYLSHGALRGMAIARIPLHTIGPLEQLTKII